MQSEDIRIRNLDKDSDIEDYVSFFNIANADDPEHRDMTAEQAREFIFDNPKYDADSHFLAFLDGRIVGSARAMIFNEIMGTVSMLVSPDYRFRGIERALLRRATEYFASKNVSDLSVSVNSESTELIEIYKSEGFSYHSTGYSMSRDLCEDIPQPTPRGGYTLGGAEMHETDAVAEVLSMGFSDDEGGSSAIVSNFIDLSKQKFYDPGGLRVARETQTGTIVGMVLVLVHPAAPELGHVPWLAVLKGNRNLGLGRVLLLDGLRWLHGKAAKSARLDVDLDNSGALKLYQYCGFKTVSETLRLRKIG